MGTRVATSKGLEEPRGVFLPAAGEASGTAPPAAASWPRQIAAALARLGGLIEGTRAFLVTAALLLLFGVIGAAVLVEVRRPSIVVDRIEVPRALEERGLKAEVLASQLIDTIAALSRSAYWRAARPSVAMGWKAADFQVPALGISMAAVVRMVKGVLGLPDVRITGELVRVDDHDLLRLRIVPPRGAGAPVRVEIGPAREAQTLDQALEVAGRGVLRQLDPLAFASFLLVERIERPGERLDPEAGWRALAEVADAVTDCLGACDAADRGPAYGVWGEALRRVAARMPDPEAARMLREEAIEKFALARTLGEPSSEVLVREADTLVELGGPRGFERYAELAARRPDDPQIRRDWARRLAAAGRAGEAADQLELARRPRPLDPWLAFEHGKALQLAGRAEPAIAAFR